MHSSFIFLFIFSSNAQENVKALERHWKPNVEKIQIISYNIFNGFDWRKDTERQERFIKWVINKDPEVLAMQELCGFTQESLSELAKEWGHMYAVIVKEGGYPVGLTSKKPIIHDKRGGNRMRCIGCRAGGTRATIGCNNQT